MWSLAGLLVFALQVGADQRQPCPPEERPELEITQMWWLSADVAPNPIPNRPAMPPCLETWIFDTIRLFRESRAALPRIQYAGELAQIGTPARSAEPALLTVLKQTAPRTALATAIVDALRRIDAKSAESRAFIHAADVDTVSRATVDERLARIGIETPRLIEALAGREPNLRAAIIARLAGRGATIDPALLGALARHSDIAVRVGAAEVLNRRQQFAKLTMWAFAQAFRANDEELVLEIFDAVRGQREEVETILIPAVRDFLQVNRNRALRKQAVTYVLQMTPWDSPWLVPFILEGLTNDDPWTVAASLRALSQHPDAASAAIARAIELASDPDADIRQAALSALIKIGFRNAAAVGAVENAVSNSSTAEQESLVREIQLCGDCGSSFAHLLFTLAAHAKSPAVRAQSAFVLINTTAADARFDVGVRLFSIPAAREAAIGALAERPEEGLPVVLDAYEQAPSKEKRKIAEDVRLVASQFRREPKSVPAARIVRIALQMMSDDDPIVRHAGLTLAAHMNAHADRLVPAIASLLDDPHDEIRRDTISTLATWNASRAAAQMLSHHSDRAAMAASDVLVRLPELPPEISPALEAAALSGNAHVSRNAITALRRSPVGGDALARLASHAPLAVRRQIIRALGLPHAWTSPAALILLIAALSDDDAEIARASAWSLGDWGERAQEALPQLVNTLGHAHRYVRFAAGRAIRRIDGFSNGLLIEALRSDTVMVRVGAAEALGFLFDRASDAEDAIRPLTSDPDLSVQAAARTALTRTSTTLRYAAEMRPLVAISNPLPLLPAEERLVADVFIDDRGNVIDAVLRDGVTPDLNAVAMAVIGRWRFKPPVDSTGAAGTVQIAVVIGGDLEHF